MTPAPTTLARPVVQLAQIVTRLRNAGHTHAATTLSVTLPGLEPLRYHVEVCAESFELRVDGVSITLEDDLAYWLNLLEQHKRAQVQTREAERLEACDGRR